MPVPVENGRQNLQGDVMENSGQSTFKTGDMGDGTFTNPVIWADFPDPDVIRVGDVFYMVSTTMFVFPGVTILKSYDLVNWEYCNNAVKRMNYHQFYNLDGGNRYGHGQWATSIRYYDGMFYLLFITLDEGGFICSTKDPGSDWEMTRLPRGFYDPGLFFDDDGRIYVAHGYSNISVTELNPDFSPKGEDVHVFKGDIRPGLEGSHVYKRNGYYYILCTYGGRDGFQSCLRSKNIFGPFEQKIILQDDADLPGYGLHQASIVQTQTGEYWALIFQDRQSVGRIPHLEPVEWIDDWPILGVGGKGVINHRKPDVGATYPTTNLDQSDEFDKPELGMQWGWNHNPDPAKWSLTERPGYLRLKTANVPADLRDARNTLTRRIFGPVSVATIELDAAYMAEGDMAGLAVFQDPYAFIGIRMIGGERRIIMSDNGTTVCSEKIDVPVVYLRVNADCVNNRSVFSYSLDNLSFGGFGNTMDMDFKLNIFTGNKFCIFNYATNAAGGFVDIGWFRVE
jgi:beta-xylosidase